MKYRIRHYTEYDYQDTVSICCNRLCLIPINLPEQECIASDVSVTPAPDEISYRTDFFGNQLAFFSIYQEHKKLRINSNSVVHIESRINAEKGPTSTIRWKEVASKIAAELHQAQDVIQYLLPSLYVHYSQVIKDFAVECFPDDATLWDASNALMKKIFTSVEFKPGFTTVNTPVETVIKIKKGVCQDFAHLMIACFRNMGLPARYVSGYLETIPPPGKKKLVGADASHAWVSVYFPDLGWVEFDPTNCILPAYKHITVGFGRDYQDVAPIKGIVFSSGGQKLSVQVDVMRLD